MPHTHRLIAATPSGVASSLAASWFCGYCGVPWVSADVAAPSARVCGECGMGLLLHARAEAAPEPGEAFVVVDSSLTVHAVSRTAELRLRVRERQAVDRHMSEFLLPADAEEHGPAGLADAIARVADGHDKGRSALLRLAARSRVRLRARIVACGPRPAALVVLCPLEKTLGSAVDSGSWAA